MLGVNDSGRLALVRKNSPKCCVLVEKTEYAALAAFKVRVRVKVMVRVRVRVRV